MQQAGKTVDTIQEQGKIVARLLNSFAAMQDSLNRHMGDIRQVNDETAQRNEELQQASQLVAESDRQKTLFIVELPL